MSDLRWTLLILGVVFIAGLSWWERRRPRQAFAPRLREASLGHPDTMGAPPPGMASGTGLSREPWIGDTDLSDAVLPDVALSDAAEEQAPAGDSAIRMHVEPSVPGPLEELPTLIIPDEEEQVALRVAWDEAPPEPRLFDPEDASAADGPETARAEADRATERLQAEADADADADADAEAEAEPDADADADADAEADGEAEPSEPEIAGAEGVGSVRIVESAACGDGAASVEPIVEWPPEESRRIVALRLVAAQPERFAGRTLRLALAAEGFLLGKFSIFHKPDESNRAVLSAASLTRPGAFDLETMDLQRYAGLSLFAVLPGPKTPSQAFEELLATARNLNERLQGALQDERGGPLTPLRVASLRDSLKAAAASPPPADAHER
jgi:FtsZ-interacting cell division protein ZipA